jgi:hypothetical protein
MKLYNVTIKYFDAPDQIVENVRATSRIHATQIVHDSHVKTEPNYQTDFKTGWASIEAVRIKE